MPPLKKKLHLLDFTTKPYSQKQLAVAQNSNFEYVLPIMPS
jgi:hypothetical protein